MPSIQPTKVAIHLHPAIVRLEWAALRCYFEDVRTPAILGALTELKEMSKQGAPFVAYWRALTLPEPQRRWTAALTAFGSILGAIDLDRIEAALRPPPLDGPDAGHFLLNEVEAGLLFAEIALTVGCHPPRALDSIDQANRAYQTVFQLKERAQVSRQEKDRLENGMRNLKAALRELDIQA